MNIDKKLHLLQGSGAQVKVTADSHSELVATAGLLQRGDLRTNTRVNYVLISYCLSLFPANISNCY